MAVCALGQISCGNGGHNSCLVTAVHDGDTFYCAKRVFRIFGIDTPEINNAYRSVSTVQSIYGTIATNYTRQRLLGKAIEHKDITIDHYGRQVAKIFIDKCDLALELLTNGYAQVAYISVSPGSPFYTYDYTYYQKLLKAQIAAYTHHLGIWRSALPINQIFP